MYKRQLEVIRRLKTEYPDAGCTLDYDHAWQLLVSVRLAAQCTDARVNIVVQDLFAKCPNVAALAAAEPEEIEAMVKLLMRFYDVDSGSIPLNGHDIRDFDRSALRLSLIHI